MGLPRAGWQGKNGSRRDFPGDASASGGEGDDFHAVSRVDLRLREMAWQHGLVVDFGDNGLAGEAEGFEQSGEARGCGECVGLAVKGDFHGRVYSSPLRQLLGEGAIFAAGEIL